MVVLLGACRLARMEPKVPEAPLNIQQEIQNRVSQYVREHMSTNYDGPIPRGTRLQRVEVKDSSVKLYFDQGLSYQPVRQALVDDLRERFGALIAPLVEGAIIEIYVRERRLEDFIPGLYRPPGPLAETLTPSDEKRQRSGTDAAERAL
jgi:hypothetical protein